MKAFLLLITIALVQGQIDLSVFERKVFSQQGEDGVILKLVELLGIKNGYYVEFGVESGHECNTRLLREQHGWQGLMMDGRFHNPQINLQKEIVTAENINQLFHKHGVPDDFDLLSIDIDYNDFYVWKAITTRPKIVIIEYNVVHGFDQDKIVLYDPKGWWDHSDYYGASMLALYKLGRSKGYSLVYAERVGVNLFFIRDDLIGDLKFKNINNPAKLYHPPKYRHVPDPKHRPYTSSKVVGV